MSEVLLDSRAYAEAIKTAVKAQLGPNECYDYDEVPGTNGNSGIQPNIYAVVSLERIVNSAPQRMSAQAGTAEWRVAVRANGRTVDDVRWVLFKASTALNENRLAIDGGTTTPLEYDGSLEAPNFDDGRFTAADAYTFAL